MAREYAVISAVRVDFFASLPPEMVLNILSNLDSEDAVHCLAVSKLWREVVGSQDGFWKKACVEFGLSEDLIEDQIQHKKCCASPVALFLAARRQRLYVSGSSGVFARLEREASECPGTAPAAKKRKSQKKYQAPCRTLYVGNGYIVEIVYAKEHLIPGGWNHSGYFAPRREVTQVLLERFNGAKIEKVCDISPDFSNGRWFHVSAHHQCIVTVSRSCITVDGSQRDTKCSKQSFTPAPKSLHATSQPLSLPFPAGYDPSVLTYSEDMYSACSLCSIMVVAITVRPSATRLVDPSVPSTSIWHFNFITFDQAGELALVHTEKVNFHVPCYLYTVALLSCPNSCLTSNICSSHKLIVQVDRNIGIYQVETILTPCLSLHFNPLYFFEFEGESDDQQVGWHLNTGTMMVSLDGKLLGILRHPNTSPILHLWSLTSFSCTKVGEVGIYQRLTHPVLHALGHTYSIIHSLSHDVPEESTAVNISVITTHTGETVWKCTKLARNITHHTPGYCVARCQPEIEFLAVVSDDWLSNIHTVSSPLMPFIAFSNFAEAVKGNVAIDGLSFQP